MYRTGREMDWGPLERNGASVYRTGGNMDWGSLERQRCSHRVDWAGDVRGMGI